MRIVVSFLQMVGFGGTETYVLTVAGELQRLGHDVVVHAPETGPCAEFARAHGIPVEAHEADLPAACDAVFAQDAITAYRMAPRYPDAARVFVAHSTSYPVQSPPQLEDVCQAVVVMNDRVRRRTEELAWHPRIARLRQPIDLQRFCFRALNLEQRRPPRVLLLSNYTQGTRSRMIERACAMAGLEFRHSGRTALPTPTPEQEIAQAEVVISLGRGALEAMASGRAAYVLGDAGGDGWVTADTYPALEADGFSGRALGQAIGLERLADDLTGWREEMGEVGRDLACTHHDVTDHAEALLELVSDLGAVRPRPPNVPDEVQRLIALEWDRNMQARSAAAETALARAESAELRSDVSALRDEMRGLRAELEEAQQRGAELEDRLRELVQTRRYRWASRLAAPLDRRRSR